MLNQRRQRLSVELDPGQGTDPGTIRPLSAVTLPHILTVHQVSKPVKSTLGLSSGESGPAPGWPPQSPDQK